MIEKPGEYREYYTSFQNGNPLVNTHGVSLVDPQCVWKVQRRCLGSWPVAVTRDDEMQQILCQHGIEFSLVV